MAVTEKANSGITVTGGTCRNKTNRKGTINAKEKTEKIEYNIFESNINKMLLLKRRAYFMTWR
jgi:hypothetical protein